MGKGLKKLLKKIVAKDAHEQLAVSDSKLAGTIKVRTINFAKTASLLQSACSTVLHVAFRLGEWGGKTTQIITFSCFCEIFILYSIDWFIVCFWFVYFFLKQEIFLFLGQVKYYLCIIDCCT